MTLLDLLERGWQVLLAGTERSADIFDPQATERDDFHQALYVWGYSSKVVVGFQVIWNDRGALDTRDLLHQRAHETDAIFARAAMDQHGIRLSLEAHLDEVTGLRPHFISQVACICQLTICAIKAETPSQFLP